MAEVTLDFLGEQMRRLLDEQRQLAAAVAAVRGDVTSLRDDFGTIRERGDLTARAIEATRQQLLAQLELARIDLLEAITVETKSEAIGTRTRIEQQIDSILGQIDELARRLETLEKGR